MQVIVLLMGWKGPRELGWKGKLAIITAIIVIVAAALLYSVINSDYVQVSYGFEVGGLGTPEGYTINPPNNLFPIFFGESNGGTIAAVPTVRISVVNATIFHVEIYSVPQSVQHYYCQYNGTLATISNLTLGRGGSILVAMIINVTLGAQSFSLSSSATLPQDWFHVKNTIVGSTTELNYNQTSPNRYLLDPM
jgi:hypothetical protein